MGQALSFRSLQRLIVTHFESSPPCTPPLLHNPSFLPLRLVNFLFCAAKLVATADFRCPQGPDCEVGELQCWGTESCHAKAEAHQASQVCCETEGATPGRSERVSGSLASCFVAWLAPMCILFLACARAVGPHVSHPNALDWYPCFWGGKVPRKWPPCGAWNERWQPIDIGGDVERERGEAGAA